MKDNIPLRERNKQAARDMMLDAAERLLQTSATAEFSMRALAAEAGVGFATPFNHFGSKTAIMQALSSRIIDTMAARFRAAALPGEAHHDTAHKGDAPQGDAIDGVLAMGRIAVGVLVEQPEVSKTVVGSLGLPGPVPSTVRPQSQALWTLALGDLGGLAQDRRTAAAAVLPSQLAFLFRGCLSFWIAGELSDDQFLSAFSTGAAALLLAFADPDHRTLLEDRIRAGDAGAAG